MALKEYKILSKVPLIRALSRLCSFLHLYWYCIPQMPAPSGPTSHIVDILPSSTSDLKHRNDCKTVSENQISTILQKSSPSRLNTTNQVITKNAGLLATQSAKTPPTPISRCRNQAGVKALKIQTRPMHLNVDISSSTIKRKQNEVLHLSKVSGETSEIIVLTPRSPEDISLLSVFLRSSKTKRFRQTTSALWKLPTVSEITTEFSDPETIRFGPQVHFPLEIRTDLECDQGPLPSVILESIISHRSPKKVDPTPKSLLKIIPLEFLQHLEENSRICPAWTTQGRRCKFHRTVRHTSAQLQSLVAFEPSVLLLVIQQLIEALFCASHRKVASRELQSWRKELQELSKIQDCGYIFPVENERLCAVFHWIYLLGWAALSQSSPSSSLKSTTDKIVQVEPPLVNAIQEFKPYVGKAFSGTTSEELAKLLTKPLQKSDIKYQGSMYIFWQPPNFGHLKIGRSQNVPRRLEQWNKQCKKTMQFFFPEEKGAANMPDLQQIPHISRVEALVHLELMHCRRIEKKCPGCFKSHVEWFETSKDIAIGVVRKWSDWMVTLPYEKHMKDGEEQWVLKSEERKRLGDLCLPGIKFATPRLAIAKEEEISPHRLRHSTPLQVRDGRKGRRSLD